MICVCVDNCLYIIFSLFYNKYLFYSYNGILFLFFFSFENSLYNMRKPVYLESLENYLCFFLTSQYWQFLDFVYFLLIYKLVEELVYSTIRICSTDKLNQLILLFLVWNWVLGPLRLFYLKSSFNIVLCCNLICVFIISHSDIT